MKGSSCSLLIIINYSLYSLRFTFGVCWPHTVPLRHAVAVGASGVGAVVGRRHGRSPLAEKNPRRHGLWPSRRFHCPSVELVVCQAAILRVQIVLRRATVLRDFRGLLNYYRLLFGAFLLLLGFLLLLLLTHVLLANTYRNSHYNYVKILSWHTWWESFAAAAASPVSMEATRAPSLAGRSCRGTEGPTRAVMTLN